MYRCLYYNSPRSRSEQGRPEGPILRVFHNACIAIFISLDVRVRNVYETMTWPNWPYQKRSLPQNVVEKPSGQVEHVSVVGQCPRLSDRPTAPWIWKSWSCHGVQHRVKLVSFFLDNRKLLKQTGMEITIKMIFKGFIIYFIRSINRFSRLLKVLNLDISIFYQLWYPRAIEVKIINI